MRKIFIRVPIIFFWVLLIFGALYWPKLQLFRYEKNSITVFAWGDILDPNVVEAFEKETGIKVYLNYYSSNDELLVKLKATKGQGYDLIIPSDYAVNLLAQENLLKPLDKTKLHFWESLNPRLLGHFFDPHNLYSIPFEWEIYGIGIDTTYFANRKLDRSWNLVFDPKIIDYKISMINDPIDAIQLASLYLFGPNNHPTVAQVPEIQSLLTLQKNWVEAYANFRGDYFLATKNCPVVVATSSYIWRTKRHFDFVSFVVPHEGTFITIENLCIPAASTKDPLIYRFINYLYSPSSVATHYDTFGFFPATLDTSFLDPDAQDLVLSDFSRYHFMTHFLPSQVTRDLWVSIKSSDL